MNDMFTLESIMNDFKAYKNEGKPIFKVAKKPDWAGLKNSEIESPVMEQDRFKNMLSKCISTMRNLDPKQCLEMTQGMILFFFFGGYKTFVEYAADSPSHGERLSCLVKGTHKYLKDKENFAKNLTCWKCAYNERTKDWKFYNTEGYVPLQAENSLTKYIIQMNEYIIDTYCKQEGQKDRLIKLLEKYASSASGVPPLERDASNKTDPMESRNLENLKELLSLLARSARVSENKKKKTELIAEGLTWLLTACVLRSEFPADQDEFDDALEKARKNAPKVEVIKTEEKEVPSNGMALSTGLKRTPTQIGISEIEEREKVSETDGIIPEQKVIESLMEYVENIASQNNTTAEMAASRSKDEDDEFRDYLTEVLKQKRSSHPSFQLLAADEIDSRLYPNIKEYRQIEPMGKSPADSADNNGVSCPVWEIIRDSWSDLEHRNVVILGEGGIGKTVTLFSIASPSDGTLSVPALYIPMYELADKNGNLLELDEYISKKYRRYSDRIDALATKTWDDRPRLLILLDGFNEIPFSLRRSALDVINEWHEAHPGAQVIAVSRPMDGLDLTRELAGDPIPVMLAPLEENTILEYLKEAGRKIPAKGAPVWEDLRYPLFLNLYVRTGRLRGKAPAGYPLRVMDADSGGALIWNFLQRELLRHKADRTEKAEEWVLRCAVANEYILPYLAYRMVARQRMEISFDEAVSWTDEAISQFDSNSLPQHLKAVWETYRRRHVSFPGKDILLSGVWRDTVLRDTGILIPLAEQNSEAGAMNDNYVFMHQHFRDCLAGLYLVNQAEAAGDDGLPEVWRHSQNYLAMDYAAELMDDSTADRLWEINRMNQQYGASEYEKAPSGTYTLLELQKRRKPLPKTIDFSGMDIQNMSLTRYLGQDGVDLSLFQAPHLSRDTVLNLSTFQSEGHFTKVGRVAVLPDGRIVSVSWDGNLRVWDPSNGRCLLTLSEPVSCVAVLPDGRIVSGSGDGNLRMWAPSDGRCLLTLTGHSNYISCVAVLPDGRIVSGSDDRTLRVWDPSTGQCLQILEGHSKGGFCVAVLPDGHIVSGSYDKTLRVWDPSTGQCLMTLKGHTGWISCVAVLPDGRIVSGSGDGNLRMWDPSTGQCLMTLKGHTGRINCVAVLPDGRIVSGSDDRTLRVWDPSTGECLQILEGHSNYINCVAVLNDGRVVSGSDDRTLRVWDPSTGECLQILEGHSGIVYCMAVLPDRRIVSGSWDSSLRVWNLSNGSCSLTLSRHSNSINCVAVLHDGRIVSGSDDRTLRVWDPLNGRCLLTLKGHSGEVFDVAVLPDGHIVSKSTYRTLRVWDSSTGRLLEEGHYDSDRVLHMSVLPDGYIISSSIWSDYSLWVEDLSEERCLPTLKGHSNSVYCVAVLPDGHIVSGSEDRTLRVWDPSTGRCLLTLSGHSGAVVKVAVLPDGRIVSGSHDKTLRVWDPSTGQCWQILEGHSNWINCVTVLPDGRIVSGSEDRTLRVWDSSTGQCLQILEGHSDRVSCVAVLPDGHIVSGSWDNTLRVWDPDTGICIEIMETTEIDVSQMDLSQAILTDDLAKLLWQNGAKIPNTVGFQH